MRFPTSESLDGSDAMHADPDYSAAYVILRTEPAPASKATASRSHSAAAPSCASPPPTTCAASSRDASLDEITADFAGFWRMLARDGQFRWIGPEKGVVHLATAAVINALWDLWAKAEGKPLWKLLTDMPAEQLVAHRRLQLPHRRADACRRLEPS